MSADDYAKWVAFKKALARREAAVQAFKRDAHYKELDLPPCCASCDFECDLECLLCGADFSVSPFGICDRYKRAEL